MGVPKFFRWMSERYPAISQLIAENRIPEFDCLYLDMNGIIHNCTHSDSDSATFRMTEEKMFIQIFNYIEHLFGKIQPQKLFFMAIDGVAPRAKMNQQRARRFRTALDAERAKEKAISSGVEMPAEAAFDSNCITPGTEFMAKLTKQLKYFINKKISEDVAWQTCDVVLSGHEVPGEGEHKIMEYIRLAKAQTNYDANLRHCLYGLDADLIMLGLLSHDPHFCLLREEVTFGRSREKKSKELEHQNFYLMHLCVVREYLELEFQELKSPGALTFPFNMERVIDDFILMAFFVGNDFLPNLPNLHINEGALALMFKIYKSVLPKAGGYINEGGVINVSRLRILLEEISQVEYRFFESDNADASWFKGKKMAKVDVMEKTPQPATEPLSMTSSQKVVYGQIRAQVIHNISEQDSILDLSPKLKAADRAFVQQLAAELHIEFFTVENIKGERHPRLVMPDIDEDEAANAVLRIFKKYDAAPIKDITADDAKEQMERKYQEKFQGWKNKYYREKFAWQPKESPEELQSLTRNYVQGLQWVLYYYYRGVASWPWFYAYHYSPMISDVQHGLDADMNFDLGQPFRPYQQLMGVLPDRSKSIVPTAYHDLMTQADSPIIDFYPRDFLLDMNGKKMEWEAVVKIPFIDESRLLNAMRTKEHLLTDEQRARNDFGVSLKFSFSPTANFTYPSSLVGIFPEIANCHCVENIFDLPTFEGVDYHVGLMDGVKIGKAALYGFPSLTNLPFHGALAFHGVSVFQQESRNESMVVTLLQSEERTKVSAAKQLLGKRVHVGFPYLTEAKVVGVSDEMFRYSLPNEATPHGPRDLESFQRKIHHIESQYSKRLGMVIGGIDALVHVDILKGLQKTDDGSTVKEFAQVSGIETDYAAQTVVTEVQNEDARFIEQAALPVEQEYPIASRAFFMGEYNFGRPLQVVGHGKDKVDIWISAGLTKMPEFGRQIVAEMDSLSPYSPSFAVAKALSLNPLVLSKITSAFQVTTHDGKANLGLNLKFESKKLKVLGYSRRDASGWEFSDKAVDLIRRYMLAFPDFIAGVQRNARSNAYDISDFFPGPQAKDRLREILGWLKAAESKGFDKVPLDAEQLDSDTVHRIEAATNAAAEAEAANRAQNRKIKAVPRNALLKPVDAEQRLHNQRFSLGDRVVYVQESGRVPIATRGVVVGKTRTARMLLLDIVFESTFMSGTSLEDRCSPFRGSTVPCHSVLNLTDKQLIAGSRSKQSTAPPVAAKILGQEQLTPAAPPQPLKGSFSSAMQQIPHRPAKPEPDGFQLQMQALLDNSLRGTAQPSYAAMPPPPAITQMDQRGRGRGSRRGRGPRSRGARGALVSTV